MATTQQEQCYAGQSFLERGREFASLEDVQRFVDALRDEPWWTAQGYGIKCLRIEVGATRSKKFNGVGWFEADKGAGRIELAKDGMHMHTVLHEVAHVLAAANHGSKSHDPWWARTYLTLVSLVMGGDAYLSLQRGFDTYGVDYDAPTATRPGVIAL